jgi:ABC-type branched-subunit amino acid transport system ATPase component
MAYFSTAAYICSFVATMSQKSSLIQDANFVSGALTGDKPSIVKSIEGAIASLKGRMSILLVEQYFDFARSLADRFVVLNRGAVALSGTGAEMDRDTLGRYLSI